MHISLFLKKSWMTLVILTFLSCGGCGGSGSKDAPEITLSDSSHDFESVAFGRAKDKRFQIFNNGDGDLKIGQISLSGPFAIVNDVCSNKTLYIDGTCYFTARFIPTDEGAATGAVYIPSNDSDKRTSTISLTGTGLAGNLSVSPETYDFDGVVLNNKLDKELIITNNGTAPLTIGTISGTGSPFSILNNSDACSGQTVAVDGTCSLIVSFSPTNQGSFAGKLTIPSNDPETPAYLNLAGEGYGLNVWINKINADPDTCETTIDVTVMDPKSDVVLSSLTESDFTFYQDDIELPSNSIINFEFESPSPVSAVLAIDWSGSTSGIIETIQASAISFLDNLNVGSDEAAVCKFSGGIGFDPASDAADKFYSTDFTPLKTYISGNFISGGTMLYDAIYASLDRAELGSKDRKAVIIISDGVNVSESTYALEEAIARAVELGIPVFSIYYADPNYSAQSYGKPDIMRQIAEETGGKFYDGTGGNLNLTDVYKQISNILTNRYTISFTSDGCEAGTSSALDVQVDYNSLYGQDSGTISF